MYDQAKLTITASQTSNSTSSSRLSFLAFYGFTLLLYLRPQEMFPEVFGSFPIVRIFALLAVGAYLIWRLQRGGKLTIWPIELKMVVVIALLGLLFVPIAKAPGDSINELADVFVKVVVVFALMINIIDTKERLNSILKLVVVLSTFMAAAAIRSYLTGEFTPKTTRIYGVVSGLGNPNDLATSLDLVIPFAVLLAVLTNGIKRLFFIGCGLLLAGGTIVTFSRGGFLGLLAIFIFLTWKLGRRRIATATMVLMLLMTIFMIAAPSSYTGRLSSILHPNADMTGSAEARLNLLNRATELAITHPLIGLGMANFHIYSIEEQRAHNSYLEIAAELGMIGLIAYLIVLFGPFRYLRKIEKDNLAADGGKRNLRDQLRTGNFYYLSVAIQCSLLAYAVCSFFGSIQYMWDLYYIVAYAVVLKGIAMTQSAPALIKHATKNTEKGVLWSRNGWHGNPAEAAGD